MVSDEKNFKAIEAKILKQKEDWPSKLSKACLDKAIENIAPILNKKLPGKSQPPKIQKEQSIARGK